MASYYVSIVKQFGEFTFSNRYVLFTDDLGAAIDAGNAVVAIEKAVHKAGVAFVAMKIDNTILYSPDNTVVGLSGFGSVADATEWYPLENTVRVAFHTGSGKPSQKYLRLPLTGGNVAFNALEPAFQTTILANYATPLLALDAYKDVDGQEFSSATVAVRVSNRQMDRRRRNRPGFHRGWVLNGAPEP